jgi:hypothetical protein
MASHTTVGLHPSVSPRIPEDVAKQTYLARECALKSSAGSALLDRGFAAGNRWNVEARLARKIANARK